VGDAGCFRDPITAHGITDALRDAELLARAVMCGTDAALAGYEATRDEAALGLFEISDAIASFAWDLDRVKELHQALTRQMAIEVEMLRALARAPLADPDHRPAASPQARGRAPQAVLEVLP